LLASIAVLLGLAYFRNPPTVWVPALAGWLVLSAMLDMLSTPVALLLLFLLGLVATPLFIPDLRRSLISNRLLSVFRKQLPAMSDTEREALEAGTVWWDGELFSGKPNWNRLQSIPEARLSVDEQAFIDGPVDELCSLIDDWQVTEHDNDLSAEVWAFMREQGFFGMIIPKKYGGLEFSALGHSSVVAKVASRSITAAVTVMVPNSLGPAELLLHYGTDEQKDYYLPRLANGEELPCFALTGPEAGSDAGAMPDRGVVERADFGDEKDVLGIRLNWNKRYITLGPVATVLGLAFKLYDPDHLLGDEVSLGITVALIPTDTPGVTIGQRHNPLNIPFQNGPNSGEDVFIPMDWIVGGEQRVGQGWRMLMESLAVGRSISLPALSTGAGKLMAATTGAYARIRKQFKLPIGYFEGVEEPLARIAAYAYINDAVRCLTTVAVDMGEKPAVLSAIAKYNTTELMRKAINDAMDVQGGSAICLGPRNLWGRFYQSIPVGITVEGANILTRSMIVFGQGAIRAHPYLFREMEAVQNEDRHQGALDFDQTLFGHIGYFISNLSRSLVLAITDGYSSHAPDGPGRRYYQQLSRLSAAFALAADASLMLLGGSLKRREHLSGRLADALSNLYLGSAVLKHYQDQGEQAADMPLLHWSMQHCLHETQEALLELYRNLPVKPVGLMLRLISFPLGRRYAKPGDKLTHQVARLLLQPSDVRERLVNGIYRSKDTSEATGRLEDALRKVVNAEALDKRLQKALRGKLPEGILYEDILATGIADEIISAEESDVLRSAWAARTDAIQVDDFEPQEGAVRKAQGAVLRSVK
jgi:acyl-CoA dehydrogenase